MIRHLVYLGFYMVSVIKEYIQTKKKNAIPIESLMVLKVFLNLSVYQ